MLFSPAQPQSNSTKNSIVTSPKGNLPSPALVFIFSSFLPPSSPHPLIPLPPLLPLCYPSIITPPPPLVPPPPVFPVCSGGVFHPAGQSASSLSALWPTGPGPAGGPSPCVCTAVSMCVYLCSSQWRPHPSAFSSPHACCRRPPLAMHRLCSAENRAFSLKTLKGWKVPGNRTSGSHRVQVWQELCVFVLRVTSLNPLRLFLLLTKSRFSEACLMFDFMLTHSFYVSSGLCDELQ